MMSGVALAVIVLYGGDQAINGSITVGTIVAFVATLSFLFEPIQQLSQLYTTYQSGMAALEKIFGLLDIEPTLQDAPGAQETSARSGRDPLRGRVLQHEPARSAPGGRAPESDGAARGSLEHVQQPGPDGRLVGAPGPASPRWKVRRPLR